MQHSINCYHCHHQWQISLPLSRRDECPRCGKECKVCLNCRFYDRDSYHECRESEAEWVKEKDLGTYCSYFLPGSSSPSKGSGDEAKAKLDALFHESSKDDSADPSKISRLDQLFKK